MFEAFVLICALGMPAKYPYCEEVADTRGPYSTRYKCKVRIVEILQELPAYRPNFYPKGYYCHEFTTTKKQST